MLFALPMLAYAITSAQSSEIPTHEDVLPDTPSFSTSKKRMYSKVYFDQQVTAYCGCDYAAKVPDLASCGLESISEAHRAKRTEAEHVVPASEFGTTRDCWAVGGRKYCEANDPVFRTFHNDLYNLVPVVGEVNGDRSNYGFGLIEGEVRDYGSCDFEINREESRVEPGDNVRGDIARTYFYVDWLYGLDLTAGQRTLFLSWHFADPVDDLERARSERIYELQGKRNPFIR